MSRPTPTYPAFRAWVDRTAPQAGELLDGSPALQRRAMTLLFADYEPQWMEPSAFEASHGFRPALRGAYGLVELAALRPDGSYYVIALYGGSQYTAYLQAPRLADGGQNRAIVIDPKGREHAKTSPSRVHPSIAPAQAAVMLHLAAAKSPRTAADLAKGLTPGQITQITDALAYDGTLPGPYFWAPKNQGGPANQVHDRLQRLGIFAGMALTPLGREVARIRGLAPAAPTDSDTFDDTPIEDEGPLPPLTPEILAWIKKRANGLKGEFDADVALPALRLLGYQAKPLAVAQRATTSIEDGLHKHGIYRRSYTRGAPAPRAFLHGGLTSQEATYVGGGDPAAVTTLWATLEPHLRPGAAKTPPENPEDGVLYVGTIEEIDPKTFSGWWLGKGVDRYQQEPPRWWTGKAYMLTPPYWFGTAAGVRIAVDGGVYEGPVSGNAVWKFLAESGVAERAERLLGRVEAWLPRGPRDPANAVHDRHCQACFELHAMVGGALAPHGYEFPDHAYKVSGSECEGSQALPWELAKDLTERILARLVDNVAPKRRANVAHFEASKPIRLAYTKGRPTQPGEEADEWRRFDPGDEEWRSARSAAEMAERHLWTGWGSISWRRALLRRWVRSETRVEIPFITPDQLTPADKMGMPAWLQEET